MQSSMRMPWPYEANEAQENSTEAVRYEERRARLNEALHYRHISPVVQRRLLKLAAGMIVYAVAFGVWAVLSL